MIKKMIFDKSAKTLTLNEYTLFYCNEESAKQTIEEVLSSKQYEFDCDKQCPFIIDCGSEIGIATFIFKIQYPNAKIICFEPDPEGFKFLQKNIETNRLQNVTLVNAAVAGQEGVIDFFGQLNIENPDLRGNSIISTWGIQRAYFDVVKVKATKLSAYVDDEVDFLKLDIEGAEQQVLEELGAKLRLIKKIVMEVHQSEQIKEINDLNKIVMLLGKYNFDVEVISKNADLILPESLKDWVEKTHPLLYTLKARAKHR